MERPRYALPVVTRSKLVLEVASRLVHFEDKPYQQAFVMLRAQGASTWSARLFGSDSPAGIDAVARGEADLAIINPAGPLTLAYRGTGPYKEPLPLRTIAVIPSLDQFVFAVKAETQLTAFEDIGRTRRALKLSLRGQRDHTVHMMLDHILQASGYSTDELVACGSQIRYDPGLPSVPTRLGAVERGEIDAIFDEAVNAWLDRALDLGMRILPLAESTVQRLESWGYRRATIRKADHPKLPSDVLTIDFSGWPIFCREDAPDEFVATICSALDAAKADIPWQGEGPLPLERMWRDTPEGPLDVPLHPAAERFWRERYGP